MWGRSTDHLLGLRLTLLGARLEPVLDLLHSGSLLWGFVSIDGVLTLSCARRTLSRTAGLGSALGLASQDGVESLLLLAAALRRRFDLNWSLRLTRTSLWYLSFPISSSSLSSSSLRERDGDEAGNISRIYLTRFSLWRRLELSRRARAGPALSLLPTCNSRRSSFPSSPGQSPPPPYVHSPPRTCSTRASSVLTSLSWLRQLVHLRSAQQANGA